MLGKYALSPSMACAHGCAYCDGRAERYWVDGEFDSDIVVRPNLPDLLAAELPKLREKGFVSIGSGITDAYQPVERVRETTRACAEVLAGYDFPVVVMTKSAAVLRDIDLWSRVNRRSRFLLVMSLTHADDRSRAWSEPGASSVDERLDALRAYRDAGCATGVLAMPLLPGVTDTDDNLTALYDRLAAAHVDFVQPGELTLRPGRQKEWFLKRLAAEHPDLLDRYAALYAQDRASGAPVRAYRTELYPRLYAQHARVGMPLLPPHALYRGRLHRYDELSVLLHHLEVLYRAAGTDTRALVTARWRYLSWLGERKALYNRRRSFRYEDLDAELLTLAANDVGATDASASPCGLAELFGNVRLASFARSVVVDRAEFDYVSRKLRVVEEG